ncbi:MAG: LLM class flavin-dependent oxidoreductase [Candidatus Geothermarchaeales archaeon]
MKFGVALPTGMEGLMYPIPFTEPGSLLEIAQRAEGMGYDSIWPNDHFTTQIYVRETWGRSPNYFDPLITLSHIAGATERIRLATGIAVLPIRNPVILAKQAATLDILSGGRLILGIGLGAYREEFEAVHPELPLRARPVLLEEGLRALRLLLDEPVVSFKGRYVSFSGVEMFPKPVQRPLPIYIGGNAVEGIRRTAEYGDGWMPAMLTVAEIADCLEKMREFGRRAGRSVADIDIAPQFGVSIAGDRDEAFKTFGASQVYRHMVSLKESTLRGQVVDAASDILDRNLIGTPGDIIKRVEAYAEAGATHMAGLIFVGNRVGDVLEGMEVFAREVLPSF